MPYALCPDDGPPRLWRFVNGGSLPNDVVSMLDKKQNLLLINKNLFDQLGELEKHEILRTHASIEYA